MKNLWVGAVVLVGLGATNLVRADDELPQTGTIIIQGKVCTYQINDQVYPALKTKPAPTSPTFKEKWNCFWGIQGTDKTRCGCYSDTGLGCSNVAQEYRFFLGSCRDFFGAPCFKTPEDLLTISEQEYYQRIIIQNKGVNKTP
jgi:hypothetical protein